MKQITLIGLAIFFVAGLYFAAWGFAIGLDSEPAVALGIAIMCGIGLRVLLSSEE